MTTFYSSAALKKNINARSLIMRVRLCEYSSRSATVSVAVLRMGYAEVVFAEVVGCSTKTS